MFSLILKKGEIPFDIFGHKTFSVLRIISKDRFQKENYRIQSLSLIYTDKLFPNMVVPIYTKYETSYPSVMNRKLER